MKRKIRELESVNSASEELGKLKLEMETLQKQEDEWMKKEEELKHKEKMEPWNIDTICKEGKSKTVCCDSDFLNSNVIFFVRFLTKLQFSIPNKRRLRMTHSSRM